MFRPPSAEHMYMDMKDDTEHQKHLNILELEEGASLSDVKKAYRILAKVWHPDQFRSDPELAKRGQQKLHKINAAYIWLTLNYHPSTLGAIDQESVSTSSLNDLDDTELFQPRSDGGTKPFIFIVMILIVLVALIARYVSKSEDSSGIPPVIAVQDGSASVLDLVLGNIFILTVRAKEESLDPIRVTIDGGYRVPYWIEMGDTLQFKIRYKFVLERDLENSLVYVNGVQLPQEWYGEVTELRVDRERLQSWIEMSK